MQELLWSALTARKCSFAFWNSDYSLHYCTPQLLFLIMITFSNFFYNALTLYHDDLNRCVSQIDYKCRAIKLSVLTIASVQENSWICAGYINYIQLKIVMMCNSLLDASSVYAVLNKETICVSKIASFHIFEENLIYCLCLENGQPAHEWKNRTDNWNNFIVPFSERKALFRLKLVFHFCSLQRYFKKKSNTCFLRFAGRNKILAARITHVGCNI